MKRHAVASALAASSVLGLVQARGHQIQNIAELPLVISNTVESIDMKTKSAAEILKRFHANEDVERVQDSRKVRCGKGKMRNRRHVQRRGPLIVYNEDNGITKAFRNIPGVELCCVTRLNLLQLAPGGHMGRFIIWTENAFKALDSIYGTNQQSTKNYALPRSLVSNADLARLINSDEVQSALRAKKTTKPVPRKKNALKNWGTMVKLNPFAATEKRRAITQQVANTKRKALKAANADAATVESFLKKNPKQKRSPTETQKTGFSPCLKKQKTA